MTNILPTCIKCKNSIEKWSVHDDYLYEFMGDSLIGIYLTVILESTTISESDLKKMNQTEVYQILCKKCAWEYMHLKMKENHERAKNAMPMQKVKRGLKRWLEDE